MKVSTRILFFAMGLAVAVACAWSAAGDKMPQHALNADSAPHSETRRGLWALGGVLAMCLGSLPSVLRTGRPGPTPQSPPVATPELSIALAQLASQLAHDIRSPLAALQIVAQHAPELSEEKRLLMRDALQRLNDIANNVLTHYQRAALPHEAALQNHLMASLVQSTVSERRVAANKLGVELLLDVSVEAYNAFANVDSDRFRRALSHLIDQAVEASPKASPVHLHMHSDAGWVLFTLRDQGRGIAPEEIARALRGDAEPGHQYALSLAGAQAALHAFGGSMQLDSAPARGTTVRFRIPRCDAAAWFADAIKIPAKTCVLVLDDDDAIGRVWRQRIGALPPEHGLDIRVCKHIDDFIAHVKDPAITLGACLVDYELLGEDRSGLDVVLDLGLESKATVITSHYEDPDLRAQCVARQIKIVPKSYAAHVPLTVL